MSRLPFDQTIFQNTWVCPFGDPSWWVMGFPIFSNAPPYHDPCRLLQARVPFPAAPADMTLNCGICRQLLIRIAGRLPALPFLQACPCGKAARAVRDCQNPSAGSPSCGGALPPTRHGSSPGGSCHSSVRVAFNSLAIASFKVSETRAYPMVS